MTVSLCFLQYATRDILTQPQPRTQRYQLQPTHAKTAVSALILATALHVVVFNLPTQDKPAAIQPPKIISVNWIGSAQTPITQPEPQPAQAVAKPNIAPPKAKTEPKRQPKTDKAERVIARPSPVADLAPAPEIAQQAPAPAPVATSESTNSAPSMSASSSSTESPAGDSPLTLPNLNADYLDNPKPIYPSLSRQQGEQGKVLLRVLVNADGTVSQVILRKTSGHDRLDDAALDTVKQWRFVPAKRGGEAVAAWVVVPISFSLEG